MERVILEAINISKEFESRRGLIVALRDVSLTIAGQEFVAIVGRSGCGKTTLLRILAGLTQPSSGIVRSSESPASRYSENSNEVHEMIGVVFQEANLFPWYTVAENIALPLKLRGENKRSRIGRAWELCDLLGLRGFECSYPRELSGGMRQRVSIARAMSFRPRVLMMDEPFASLDAMTREKMNLELQALAVASKMTVVLVTHSIREAVFLADRVVLLSPRPGRVRSIAKVEFCKPRSIEVEDSIQFQQIVRTLRAELEED